MEADSLNCIVLGEDVEPGMPEWEIFVKEVRKEMTVKAGQKCTAIRTDICSGKQDRAICEIHFSSSVANHDR